MIERWWCSVGLSLLQHGWNRGWDCGGGCQDLGVVVARTRVKGLPVDSRDRAHQA